MSYLTHKLIKLGTECPELRDNIRPVLQRIAVRDAVAFFGEDLGPKADLSKRVRGLAEQVKKRVSDLYDSAEGEAKGTLKELFKKLDRFVWSFPSNSSASYFKVAMQLSKRVLDRTVMGLMEDLDALVERHKAASMPRVAMTQGEVEEQSVIWEDPDLKDVIQDPSAWDLDERSGTLSHEQGASVVFIGRNGRFVPRQPGGAVLRGTGKGYRHFKTYSSAIKALRESGHV